MRLAHLADLHLGFRQYQRLTSRGHNQREVDVGQAFTRAIDGVIAARPDAVVIAGDLFHAVRPTNSAILLAFREFARLRAALPEAPVLAIGGNHDTPRSAETTSIFGLFRELGVHLTPLERAERFAFPALDLSVLGVPHAALMGTPRPALEPAGAERFQVLVMHGETPGLFSRERDHAEAGGAAIEVAELETPGWSYIALGHYHVQRQVGPRAWYAGSLEYVSPNAWGERREEERLDVPGKGWLLVDLETGVVERQPIDPPRRVLDLPALDADGLSAPELDRLLGDAIAAVPGGIADAVIRQVVRQVPRPVARELDHSRIRAWKAAALHLLLDLRRPAEPEHPLAASGAPGGQRTLPMILQEALRARPLPTGLDREHFVATGRAFLDEVLAETEEE